MPTFNNKTTSDMLDPASQHAAVKAVKELKPDVLPINSDLAKRREVTNAAKREKTKADAVKNAGRSH